MTLISEKFREWELECEERFERTKENEEALNRIFIETYGLQNEMSPEVEEKYVTIRKANRKREIQSLVSYAVGCMFGRFSLDADGLAYAGGEWNGNLYKTFHPVSDNVLMITPNEIFENDITVLFINFIRTVYGSETLEENLRFIAQSLCETHKKASSQEIIREYFLNGFFKNHCRIYHKRPIYWLLDGGKKFKALIYVHRYQKETFTTIYEKYWLEFLKYEDARDEEAQKFSEKLKRWAECKIEIDADDGISHNYALFADILASIK